MWYVVQVETGREKTACDDIKQAAEDVRDECFVPQYLTGNPTVNQCRDEGVLI